MKIKNKFRGYAAKLSDKSFRMNAFLFAALWIAYIISSYHLMLRFGMNGWSILFTLPLAILFYIIVCLSLLVGLIIYCFRNRTLSISFYPKIFLALILIPQVIYILINPFRDFYPYLLKSMIIAFPYPLIYNTLILLSALIAITSIIVYIEGIKILYRRMFIFQNFSLINEPPKPLMKKIESEQLFIIIFSPIFIVVLVFVLFNHSIFRFECEQCCWIIVKEEKRDSCYRNKIINEAKKKQDELVCEKISNNKIDGCLLSLIIPGNSSVCDSRDGCYALVANSKLDPLICDAIIDETIRGRCYGNIALEKNDETLCGGFDRCYVDVALAKKDPSICGIIQKVDFRDDCYHRMVWSNRDVMLCDAIADKDRKERCRAYIK